jgi:hypothetical protein
VVNLPSSDWAALDSFAAANGLMADVPEPASLGLILFVTIGLLCVRVRPLAGTKGKTLGRPFVAYNAIESSLSLLIGRKINSRSNTKCLA